LRPLKGIWPDACKEEVIKSWTIRVSFFTSRIQNYCTMAALGVDGE